MVLGVETMVVGWWTGGRFGFYNIFGRFMVYLLEFVIVIKIYDLLLKVL